MRNGWAISISSTEAMRAAHAPMKRISCVMILQAVRKSHPRMRHGLPAGDLPPMPESLEIGKELSDYQDLSSDNEVAAPDRILCDQARAGLMEVLAC
jgi:hypothetical protein